MAASPGKYDRECTLVRDSAQADGVAVIVIGGNRGHGFSVQMTKEVMLGIPESLEEMAKSIRLELGVPHHPGQDVVLAEIRKTVLTYYDDLIARKHGQVAQDKAFKQIEQLLNLDFEDYKNMKN